MPWPRRALGSPPGWRRWHRGTSPTSLIGGWRSIFSSTRCIGSGFLIDPTIDATNYRAEQAIRPAVVNRKVWGGNRTWSGAWAQGVLTSVLVTLHQRGPQPLEWFSAA